MDKKNKSNGLTTSLKINKIKEIITKMFHDNQIEIIIKNVKTIRQIADRYKWKVDIVDKIIDIGFIALMDDGNDHIFYSKEIILFISWVNAELWIYKRVNHFGFDQEWIKGILNSLTTSLGFEYWIDINQFESDWRDQPQLLGLKEKPQDIIFFKALSSDVFWIFERLEMIDL